MVYFTGDIHGNAKEILRISTKLNLTLDDVLIILGDVGANYYGERIDCHTKNVLAKAGTTILCIHGNHEMRPSTIPTYKTKEWNGGTVWYEERHPYLLFAKDGEIYTIGKYRYIAIGGAYSVDKQWREPNVSWWADEQPSSEIKAYVEQQLATQDVDAILSHTCPFKYIPTEMFLSGIKQSGVDQSTELWLDTIEERINYKAWFCGHWHTDKRIDKMHFLYHGIEAEEYIRE